MIDMAIDLHEIFIDKFLISSFNHFGKRYTIGLTLIGLEHPFFYNYFLHPVSGLGLFFDENLTEVLNPPFAKIPSYPRPPCFVLIVWLVSFGAVMQIQVLLLVRFLLRKF